MAFSPAWALPTALFSGFAYAPFAPALVKAVGKRSGLLIAVLPLALALYFCSQLPSVSEGKALQSSSAWAPSLGIHLSLVLDGLSVFFAILIASLGAMVSFYAGDYLANHPDLGRFYAWLLVFMGSMLGIVLAGNLLLLYVFWELTTLSSFLLIGFEHEREEARTNAWQAILVTTAGGLALLAGILLLGRIGGTYEISALASRSEEIRSHSLYLPALLLVLAGAFTKSAQFPFHFWLPNAMAAPAPVSAYLHSATMVKAGIYLLARLYPVLSQTEQWFYLVSATGALTMLTGSLLAMRQTDLKRLLAYMTIMALGALVMLLGIGTPEALNAAMVFLLVHSLYKGALFLVAGTVDHETGTRNVLDLGGLSHKMRLTSTAALLSALSMAGMPPLVGFIGKELIYKGALSAFGTPAAIFTGLAVFSKAASAAVAAVFFFDVFVRKPRRPLGLLHEAPTSLWLSPLFLGILSCIFGIFPGALEKPLIEPAVRAAFGRETEIRLFPGVKLDLPLALSAASLMGGLLLYSARLWIRKGLVTLDPTFRRCGPEAGYGYALAGMLGIARLQTAILQNGYLRYYLLTAFSASAVALGTAALYLPIGELTLSWPEVRIYEWTIVGLMVFGSLSAIAARSILASVTSLGVVGYAIALVYMFYGAPDLALTQFLVETLTIVLVALVAVHLPAPKGGKANWMAIFRDGFVSSAFGAAMAFALHNTLNVPFDSHLSHFFTDHSLPDGHGRNVVNVILVDFRALDTLGEITVLAVAATGVFSLIRYGRKISREK